jgi:hypothetical protein
VGLRGSRTLLIQIIDLRRLRLNKCALNLRTADVALHHGEPARPVPPWSIDQR